MPGNPTTTRRSVTIQWQRAASPAYVNSPVFDANANRVALPVWEYLPADKRYAFDFLPWHREPQTGYLLKRSGLSDIVIAYDASIAQYAGEVSTQLQYLGTPNNPGVIRLEMIHCTWRHGGGGCVRRVCSGYRIN